MNKYLLVAILVVVIMIIYICSVNVTNDRYVEKFTEQNDKTSIYIINMKYRTDKKKRMEDELKKHNLDGNFIEAIVGYDIDIDKMIENKLIDNKLDRELRRGEIGCYLSHIKAWKAFLRSDDKYALILEDDAVFIDGFKDKLKNLLKEITFSFDMIYLNDNCEHHFGEDCLHGIKKSENIFDPGTVGYGLYGYLLSREGAKKLIEISLPIEIPIDDKTMHMHKEGTLDAYKLIDPYIFVASVTDSDTMKIK